MRKLLTLTSLIDLAGAVAMAAAHSAGTAPTTRISVSTAGVQGDDGSSVGGAGAGLELSSGARVLAFPSWAANLVDDDTNDTPEAFVRELRR